ncbi:TIGR03826 family flagellar region protein [Sporolactobacillus inulinus]|uniref:Membrane protein n=1 Tax=Sporolactobacillus inulinus CASD TaxID=1069536 RepID=A0A0U1QRM0_9BACL|nr:TIGR03826 family flagellar region protein [Sporolactobacillus inulinus]KLI03429.1 membrane protein [Sporolactobacillus inulinus CASD]GEB77205.1 hypothetical protein SIN01_15500 [Sporolactobacillus inulinus]
MAELENCKECGKLFVRVSSPYCPACLKKQEAQFEQVYRYIRQQEHRMATVSQVHEATDVSVNLIYQWIREGRLKPSIFQNLGYPCRSCGKMIQSGVLCEDCLKKLEHDIDQDEDERNAALKANRAKTYHTRGESRHN